MRTLFDSGPAGSTALLVMLPAAKARPEDFVAHGFVAAVRDRGLRLDIALADAHPGLYLDGDIAAQMESELMQPLRAKGYAAIWLAGVSLGGMGCVAYACRHGAGISGMLLLAPFLGLPSPSCLPSWRRRRCPRFSSATARRTAMRARASCWRGGCLPGG
jgi:pimeloyl-ACP methyl ester carboxylesterase